MVAFLTAHQTASQHFTNDDYIALVAHLNQRNDRKGD